MKKKIISLVMASMMTILAVGCGSSNEKASESQEQTESTAEATGAVESAETAKAEISTVTAGKLTVATSPDFAPYEFYAVDESGTPQLAGFDIALAQYIADYLGLELEVVPVDFDGVLMELQTKAVDLGVAGLSPDPKRESIMDFSDIYYEGGQSFVCTQANKDKFTTLEDLNVAGLEVAAQTGSIQVDLAQANSPDADIIQLTKVTDIVAELIAGKLDGAYIETAVAESYAKNYPDLCVVLDVPYEEAEGSAIGISKGNDALKEAVNEAIKSAIDSGKMDEFIATANEQASGEIIEGLLDN
ncbi:transporter substrate-binding domain-containing protein [Butyrivibrio sp.]|uniref:transporter substrate-binding domain-containing protein n=1 Tax=Butyrivibrio sp. TaxID=28121 RepID=UPI0025C4BC6F|nr:transporter substrate-binding domain-containing protein [Butyrivibrio sp.]